MKTITNITILVFSCATLYAQSVTLWQANKAFENMEYATAIPLFEDVLKRHSENKEARIKLADSYRKTGDLQNAVRVYSALAHDNAASAMNMWYYAQLLAEDGQHDEALKWHTKYNELVPTDERGVRFLNAYKNLGQFFADSATFKVKYIPSINSWQSDFSPVYHNKGLVFCSNRKKQVVVQKLSNYDQTPFVDLYFASDTSSLYTELNNDAVPVFYAVNTSKDRNSDYSPSTSNDSDAPLNYNRAFLFDSIRYDFTAKTVVTRFAHHINKSHHEGPVTFFHGKDSIIYTQTAQDRQSGKRIGHLALYMAKFNGGKIEGAQRLPFSKKTYSVGHPALTPDNKRLYFASDMPGSVGGTDIYYADFDNGTWSEPINVKEINTLGDELFPFVDQKGNLYFASDGHPGLGGLDIFYAPLDNGKITSFKNIGAPLNSYKNDYGITVDHTLKKGFFSSNRKRGGSDDDIYYFDKFCEKTQLEVYDSTSRLPLPNTEIHIALSNGTSDAEGKASFCLPAGNKKVTLTHQAYEPSEIHSSSSVIKVYMKPISFASEGLIVSEEDKKPIKGVKVKLVDELTKKISEWTTEDSGSYHFPLDLNKKYHLLISKENCGTYTKDISTVGLSSSNVFKNDFGLLCKGDVITLKNIYYDLNKYELRPDALTELDKLADLMVQYPDMRIELRSHTDSRSSSTDNMKLSTHRAEAVVDYLATKGIVHQRMRAAGYGESLPLNNCNDGTPCKEEEYQVNRRTEFKVLYIK